MVTPLSKQQSIIKEQVHDGTYVILVYLGMRSQDVDKRPCTRSNSVVEKESSVSVTFWAELMRKKGTQKRKIK